jgi:hypothetical protein
MELKRATRREATAAQARDTEAGSLASCWEAVRQLDADLIASLFEGGATLWFGNSRRADGRGAIRRTLVQLLSKTEAIEGRVVALWQKQGIVIADVDLEVRFDDGSGVTVPFTIEIWFCDCLIRVCRLSFYPEPALEPAVFRSGFGRSWPASSPAVSGLRSAASLPPCSTRRTCRRPLI